MEVDLISDEDTVTWVEKVLDLLLKKGFEARIGYGL